MIELDGSSGEGGGQMVRTALALSAVTKKAFRIMNIRAGRPNPGLNAQHLHCIEGIKKLSNAAVEGNAEGSTTIEVIPRELQAKTIVLDVGTAGSISLVLQSLLLPSLFAKGKTKMIIKGGTDVQWAIPLDYLNYVFLPHLRKYADIELTMQQRGYYPAGGGRIELTIEPKFEVDYQDELFSLLPKISLMKQQHLLNIKGISHAAKQLEGNKVAERQANAAQELLRTKNVPIQVATTYAAKSLSIGSGITLWAQFGNNEGMDFGNPVILGADAIGEKGKTAEEVGKEAAQQLKEAISSGGCVDKHCADNLIPYLGLFGGEIKVAEITEHTTTNIMVTEAFLGVKFKIDGKVISV